MSELTIPAAERGESRVVGRGWLATRVSRRAAVLLGAYFVVTIALFGYLGIERMFSQWTWLNDIHYFHAAAKLILTSQRDILYQNELRASLLDPRPPDNWEVFPYPATLALIFWPIGKTTLESAREIFLGISVASAFGLVLVAYFWSRDWLFALLVALAYASLFPLYEGLRFSQLTPVATLLMAVAYVTLERSGVRGGFVAGLLALKPSIAAAPLAFLLWRRDWNAVVAATIMGLLVVFVIPLALVGVDGIREYFEQLGRYRDEALVLNGQFTAGAGWMLNWHGFIGKLLVRDVSWPAVLPFMIATVALMLRAWSRADLAHGWVASVLGTLLVVPHALWYDWALLLAVAPFAVYKSRSVPLLVMLVALHLSVSIDSYVIVTTKAESFFVFTTTPIAAAILVYLAFFSRTLPSPPVPLPPSRTRRVGDGSTMVAQPASD